MRSRSPLHYDVSVSAQKRRQTRRRGMSGEFETEGRTCDWPDCQGQARFRAPQARDRLSDYFWFCLDHIRDYNSSWNYFGEQTAEEIEAQMRADATWDRPTWRFGRQPRNPMGANPHSEGEAWKRFGFSDPMQVLGERATINPAGAAPRAARRRTLPKNERRALDILNADDGATRTALRKVFKELVKTLHPDMNGGDRSEEARLREVLWAWDQVKGSRSFPD